MLNVEIKKDERNIITIFFKVILARNIFFLHMFEAHSKLYLNGHTYIYMYIDENKITYLQLTINPIYVDTEIIIEFPIRLSFIAFVEVKSSSTSMTRSINYFVYMYIDAALTIIRYSSIYAILSLAIFNLYKLFKAY